MPFPGVSAWQIPTHLSRLSKGNISLQPFLTFLLLVELIGHPFLCSITLPSTDFHEVPNTLLLIYLPISPLSHHPETKIWLWSWNAFTYAHNSTTQFCIWHTFQEMIEMVFSERVKCAIHKEEHETGHRTNSTGSCNMSRPNAFSLLTQASLPSPQSSIRCSSPETDLCSQTPLWPVCCDLDLSSFALMP